MILEQIGNYLYVLMDDGTPLRFTPSAIEQAKRSYDVVKRRAEYPQLPSWEGRPNGRISRTEETEKD